MFRITVTLALGCLLTCAVGWAQAVSTAQINGSVRDASGLAVPGAEIKATQTATGLVRTVSSGPDGSYTLTNLPIGPYQVEISKEGFGKYVQSGIVLQVGGSPTIDAALNVGSVSDQVLVQADAALVETHSTGVGTVVDNQRILEMPLNGRNPTELILLAGASIGNGTALNTIRNYPTLLLSVAGGFGNGITYLLDGGNHNDPFNNLNLPLPFPDALQEFKVETSALPAQYGYHSTAAVNAVTKSGTNELHGDAFEFLRNGDLNARNFFAASRDTLKRNQFGGVLGGPVKKDKLFFFAGYQGTIVRSAPPQSIAYVPTAAMLAGDFTTFASAACNTSGAVTLKAPFVGNKISPALFSAPAVNLAGRLPHTTDPCGKITYGLIQNSGENMGVTRVDYQITPKHSLFGRYELARYVPSSSYDGSNVLTATTAPTFDRAQSFVIGDTYLIGSSTVSSFRATVNRTQVEKAPDQWFSLADLGVQNVYIPIPKFSNMSVTGNGFSYGGAGETTSKFNTQSFQTGDDVSLVWRTHQLGFGANYIHPMQNVITYLNAIGSMSFNGSVTGLGLADLMLGKASGWTQGNPARNYYRQNYVGLYAQDSWRIFPRLTVSYGLRWEPFLAPWSKIGFDDHFDPALFAKGVRSSVYVNAPAGMMFPGDAGYPGDASNFNKLSNWAPRLGIVWDPKGDGRMIVRAAYGMFNDFEHLNYNNGFGLGPPFGNALSLSNVDFANPWSAYPGGNPFPIVLSKNVTFPQAGTYATQNLHPAPTYVNQWNLSIQKQIGANTLVTANYIGNSTIHLWAGNAQNAAVYLGTGPCTLQTVNASGGLSPTSYASCSTTANQNQRRVFYLQNPLEGQYLGAVTAQDDGGTQTYNGLMLSFQQRMTRGISVQGNYTWAHCIGDVVNSELGIAGPIYMIPNNRRADRSNCFFADTRHLANFSVVGQAPKFSNRWTQAVAGDWQLSGIVKANSASWFTVTSGVDVALNGAAGTQRPNQLLADPYASDRTVDHWLNPAAFANPATGTYGNLGAVNIAGPGRFNFDMALVRNLRIREKQSLQLRADAFNILNRLNAGNPVAAKNSGAFGKIQSTAAGTVGDPRIIQLAMKFVF